MIKKTIKDRLLGDPELMAILTGGLYDTGDLPNNKLSVTWLAENGKLDEWGNLPPLAVLTWGEEQPADRYRAEVHRLNIWLYQQNEDDSLDLAITRIKELLIRWIPPATASESIMDIAYAGGIMEFIDQDLGLANGRSIRFDLVVVRSV